MAEHGEDTGQYAVVRNIEEQYSIWPAHREVPQGWKALDVRGDRNTCLDYIERVWTDMRPLSLRQRDSGASADVPHAGPS